MIKNESQYEFSKEWVEKFNKTIAAMERDEEAKRKDFLNQYGDVWGVKPLRHSPTVSFNRRHYRRD